MPERGWGLFQQSYPMTARSLKLLHHRSTGPSGYRGTVEQQMGWRRELFEEMNRGGGRYRAMMLQHWW